MQLFERDSLSSTNLMKRAYRLFDKRLIQTNGDFERGSNQKALRLMYIVKKVNVPYA